MKENITGFLDPHCKNVKINVCIVLDEFQLIDKLKSDEITSLI